MAQKDIFEKFARFEIRPSEMDIPEWKTYPEFDEMDGVHAQDYLDARAAAVKELEENSYAAILFKRKRLPRNNSVLCHDLRELMKREGDPGVSFALHCFIFQYLWKKLDQGGLHAHQIFTIDRSGPIVWSDSKNYYTVGSRYSFSKIQTEFSYGVRNCTGIRNRDNLCLVLTKNPKRL